MNFWECFRNWFFSLTLAVGIPNGIKIAMTEGFLGFVVGFLFVIVLTAPAAYMRAVYESRQYRKQQSSRPES